MHIIIIAAIIFFASFKTTSSFTSCIFVAVLLQKPSKLIVDQCRNLHIKKLQMNISFILDWSKWTDQKLFGFIVHERCTYIALLYDDCSINFYANIFMSQIFHLYSLVAKYASKLAWWFVMDKRLWDFIGAWKLK